MKIKGSIAALVTPMNEDTTVNYEKLKELLDYHLNNKTDGIVILGTTGESPTLSFAEEEKMVKFTIDYINHRMIVVVGSGSNETHLAMTRSKLFESYGADYLLVITPYYNKTNDKGMIKHFESIADSVNIPIILYNVPGRTGCSISLSALEVLSKHKNICGIKEASGNMGYVTSVASICNDDFVLISGEDALIVPYMSLGGVGVISVWANICPLEVHNLCQSCLNGDFANAREIQLKHLDLINNLFIETNPIPIKEAMNYLGYNVGPTRLPLYEMDESNRDKLINSIIDLGVCK